MLTRARKFQELLECSKEDVYMHHTYQRQRGQRQGHHLHLNLLPWALGQHGVLCLTLLVLLKTDNKCCLVLKLQINTYIWKYKVGLQLLFK